MSKMTIIVALIIVGLIATNLIRGYSNTRLETPEYELIEEYSEDVEIGLVSGTLPEAGEIVTPDQLIQVVVSLGIRIEMPEVDGLSYEDAINILEELNLIATVVGDTNGKVRKQIPRKGEFVEPGQVVELTFGD